MSETDKTCPESGSTFEVDCGLCETRTDNQVKGRISLSDVLRMGGERFFGGDEYEPVPVIKISGSSGDSRRIPIIAPRAQPQSSRALVDVLGKLLAESTEKCFQDKSAPDVHLYLTHAQYDLDPEGWKAMLRQNGYPETNIVFIDLLPAGEEGSHGCR